MQPCSWSQSQCEVSWLLTVTEWDQDLPSVCKVGSWDHGWYSPYILYLIEHFARKPLPCMFLMCPRLLRLITIHLFESGVLEQRRIWNMQDGNTGSETRGFKRACHLKCFKCSGSSHRPSCVCHSSVWNNLLNSSQSKARLCVAHHDHDTQLAANVVN